MLEILNRLDSLVWGPPLLILLVGTGIYLSLRLGLLQIFRLPRAFRLIFVSDEEHQGDVSSFAALCTALAATVETGNIIGVATAIKTGGPGALFWMWVAAFFGMATKYAEGLLAIKYRRKDAHGAMAGGPMYYIFLGMGEKWRSLAIFFAIAGILVALLGIGTFTHVNSITEAMQNTIQLPPAVTASILASSPAVANVPVYAESGSPAVANVPVYAESGAPAVANIPAYAEKLEPAVNEVPEYTGSVVPLATNPTLGTKQDRTYKAPAATDEQLLPNTGSQNTSAVASLGFIGLLLGLLPFAKRKLNK